MIQLSKNMIRNLASDEKAYTRGIQYFQSGRIQNASYSKSGKRYKIIVKGNYNYTVLVEEQDNGNFLYSCNCPGAMKEKGACKHVVAALFMLLKHQERTEGMLPKNEEEQRAYRVLEYFDAQESIPMTGEVFRIEPVITLPSMLRNDNGKAYISLRAGSTKLYKVQNLKKFLEDYIRRENIVLGKEFHYIAGESAFDRNAKAILDFLLEIYDVAELGGNKEGTQIFFRSQVVLSKFLFIKFLRQFAGTAFQMELYHKVYEDVKCIPKNPVMEIELFTEDDSISLDYKEKEPVIPVSENGEILYRDGFLYLPDKRFLKNFLPFFYHLGEDKEALVFRGSYKQRFLESVLPKLHGTMDILVPEELQERYISPELKKEIYFDKYQNYIKAEVFFSYDAYRFNSFEHPQSGEYIILRKREEENEFLTLLENWGFEPYSGFYLLKADAEIYRFLQEGMDELIAHAAVYLSESFKNMRTKRNTNFSAAIRVSDEIDLLEMDIAYGDITKEELKQLFRAYRLKKKFFRLSDGSFIDMDADGIKQMVGILDDLNISAKELECSDRYQIAKGLAAYAETLMSEEHIELQKSEGFAKLLDTISQAGNKEYVLPEGICAELRPYQKTGYQWLMTLADHHLGGILADDMGLGKTLQAIVYMKAMADHNPEALFLVVCPSSLVYNWMDELENFAPGLRCRMVAGTPEERADALRDCSDTDVIVTSYPLLRRDISLYQEKTFHTVFLDEAQFIKNAASLNAKSVKALHSLHRFALTGTPIENSLSELWSIFDFIMPYYLMSYSKFSKRYERQILKLQDEKALQDLNRRIRPFVMRRMKKDVLKELPEKVESKYITELTTEQRKLYLSYLEMYRGEFVTEFATGQFSNTKFQILAALTRLRQICCHPGTFLENYEGESGKLELFLQILPDLIANHHRILVFSQFTSMLAIIEKSLKELGYSYFCLEGETKLQDRNDYVKRFNSGEGQIFLISLKAGGTGLNLTSADTVIHFDPWWNPAVEEQATDRAHRIGQKKSVQVMKLITKGTIEEKIYKLQLKKKELYDSVIDAREVFINSLTQDELKELFTFED